MFRLNNNYLNFSTAKFAWNINGAKLEIFSFDQKCNNRLISSFDFGELFNDPTIVISFVTRLVDRFEVLSNFRHPHKLIVILSLTNFQSYICIVDIRLNNVINSINFPFNITHAEVILSGTPDNIEKWPLIRELTCMNGILAVGCDGGLVFFVDLTLDSYSQAALIPKQVSFFTSNTAHIDLRNKRRTAIFHNQVICIPLNTDAKNKGKFLYRSNELKVLGTFSINHVYISALFYVPQLSLLCVGYNFGGFHLYNLNQLKLECSCSLNSELLPVVAFAFQSPENDPKNYSYLWVVRGICSRTPNMDEIPFKSCTNAILYLLCYENKEYIPTYGILYNTFISCCCKFEFFLTSNPFDKSQQLSCKSKLVDIFTVHQVNSTRTADDDLSPIDYNLLYLAWQVNTDCEKPRFYFMLFDLNQWYKSHMPDCFCIDNFDLCAFISVYSLNSAAKLMSPEPLQAVYLDNNSISKFNSNLFYSEIHSYPVSLSFNLIVASQSKLFNIHFAGYQKQLISRMVKTGPGLLLNPEEMVSKCLQYGLISTEHLMVIQDNSNDIGSKRELVLNIALENSLTAFLINVIKEWSTGEYANLKCDLKFILNWIWKKVSCVRASIDLLTKPLFDFSGCDVSQHEIRKLVSHEADLALLSVLLKQLQTNSISVTKKGLEELVVRREVVELLRYYLKIIILFEDFDLLPEQDAKDVNGDDCRPYYSSIVERLLAFYSDRRKHLKSASSQDFLLIDSIVRHLDLNMFNLKNTGDKPLYPPPSIYSLVCIFLHESIPMVYKESILLYFLLDLCDSLSESQQMCTQKILVFISSLNINQGIRNFIQGIWYLDHANYDSALQLFTHSTVATSLTDFKIDITLFNNLMQRIVEIFLFENEFKSALVFSKNCGHFLLDCEHNEMLYIQMLLLNDNLTSAFEFQRQRRSESNTYKLLYKLFFVCEKINALVKVCKLPLDSIEEKVFIDFLLHSKLPDAKIILILYLILNNKLLDAINIVHQFEEEFHSGSEEHRKILNLVDAYSSVIPQSLIKLASEISSILEKDQGGQCVESHPEPVATIKIKPKQRTVSTISMSGSIEKILEANEVANNGVAGKPNPLTPYKDR